MTQRPEEPLAKALLEQATWLRHLVRSLVEDTARIDDVCQATMLQAWQYRPKHDRSLRPWLARVARNLSNRMRGRESQRAEREAHAARTQLAPPAAEAVERVAWQQRVVSMVMGLKEPYRSTILLRFWQQSSPQEVADQMDVPAETVRTRTRRGLAMLREQLDRRCKDRREWVTALIPLGALPGGILPLTTALLMKKITVVAAALLTTLSLFYIQWEPADLPSQGTLLASEQGAKVADATPNNSTIAIANLHRQDASPLPSHSPDQDVEADPAIADALCGFAGRMIDASGNPKRGCDVRIHRCSFDRLAGVGVGLLGAPGNGPGFRQRSTTTDEHGRFLIEGVWPRGMYFLAGDSKTGGRMLQLIERAPPPGEVIDLGDLTLLGSAMIHGEVRNEDGHPVAGATVRTVDLPDELFEMIPFERLDLNGALLVRTDFLPVAPVILIPQWLRNLYHDLPIPTTVTDSDGKFRLNGVMPGTNSLLIHQSPLQPFVRHGLQIAARSATNAGSIVMRTGRKVAGRVIDANGVSVVGAEVLVAATSQGGPLDLAQAVPPSDSDGRFACSGLPTGKITVAVRRAGATAWLVAEPQSGDQEIEIKLPTACELILRVTGPHGAQVEPLQLELFAGQLSRQAITFRTLGMQAPVDLTNRLTQVDGGAWRVRDLHPGPYVIAATSTGLARTLVQVTLPTRQAVDLQLHPEQRHDVLVIDTSGKPVRNAEVLAEPNGSGSREDTPLPYNCGRTDVTGRLSVNQVRSSEVRINVTHPAYGMATTVVAGNTRDVQIVLSPPSSIDGLLLENGQPPPRGEYSMMLQFQEEADQSVIARSPSIATPQPDGRFTFGGLQPGVYALTAIMPATTSGSLGEMVSLLDNLEDGEIKTTFVEVFAGQRVPVRFVLGSDPAPTPTSASLSGAVLLDGRTHAGMQVQVRSASGDDEATARTDANGRFDTGMIAPGEYRVSIRSPADSDHPVYSLSQQLVAGQNKHIVLQVSTATIAGVALDAAGRPTSSAFVDMIRVSLTGAGIMHYRAYCDRRGRFEMKQLPAGPYQLRAMSHKPSAFAPSFAVDLVAGASQTDIQLTMQDALELHGSLDRAAHSLTTAGPITLRLFRWDKIQSGEEIQLLVAKTKVARDGSFSFVGLANGRYGLSIETGTGSNLTHDGAIEIHRTSINDLQLNPTAK